MSHRWRAAACLGGCVSGKLGVLLVDDSPAALAQLHSLAEESDVVDRVGTAEDGAAAIAMTARLRPDLVLLDVVMPGLDGITTLRVLREQSPDVRVAVLTAIGGSSTTAEEAFRLGAVQVISKPYDRELLEALFESELRLREQRSRSPADGDGAMQ